MTVRRYSKEFKLDAISLVKDKGYTQAEAARSLGIYSQLLNRWIMEDRQGNEAFRGNGKRTSEQAEVHQLREELRRVKMERDILKKATAFFAKETQ